MSSTTSGAGGALALEVRLAELTRPEGRAQRRPEYDERAEFECKTILQMGFPATS